MKKIVTADSIVGFLHAIFVSLYVDVFISRYVLKGSDDEGAGRNGVAGGRNTVDGPNMNVLWCLLGSQLIYTIWICKRNVKFQKRSGVSSPVLPVFKELLRLPVCGSLWSFCFALLWFPFGTTFLCPAITFTLLMAAYEYLFVRCRKVIGAVDRIPGSRRNAPQEAGVYGALSATAAYLLYDPPQHMWPMRGFTTICAVVGSVCFCSYRQQSLHIVDDNDNSETEDLREPVRFVRQTADRSSMKATLALWALQGYNGIIVTNFFTFFLVACSGVVPLFLRASLLFMVLVAPRGVLSGVTSFIEILGKRRLVLVILLLQIVIANFLLVVAAQDYWAILHMSNTACGASFVILLVLQRLLTDTLTHVQEWVLVDVVNEDAVIFSRDKPMAWGIRQLLDTFSGVAQRVALVLTCFHVTFVTNERVLLVKSAACVVGLPTLLTSSIMLFVWTRYYTLDGSHLQFVNMAMRRRVDGVERVV